MIAKNKEAFGTKIRTIFIIFMVLILCAMGALIGVLFVTLENNLTTERTAHLVEIVDKSSDVIDEVIQTSYSYAKIIGHVFEVDTTPSSNVYDVLDLADLLVDAENSCIVAVDDFGNYFTSSNTSGRVEFEYYDSKTEDELLYVGNLKLDGNKETECMIFRLKLSTPVTITKDGTTPITITHCALARKIDYIVQKMTQDMDTSSNTFLVDITNGTMIYRNLGYGLLIKGWNFYNKLYSNELEYIHDDKPEDFENNIRNKKTQALEVEINGEDYYIATSNVGDTDIAYSVIIKTTEYSGNLSAYEQTLLYYLIGIILLVAIAVIGCVIFAIQIANHKKMLVKEQKANQFLSEAADSAKKASTAKSEFLSHMSHDIRTPINGIMGMTDIALKVDNNPEKTVECLNKIDGASKHLLSLINDVLDMSRIESGKTTIAHKPFELKTTIDNCLSIIRGQIGNRDLYVEFNDNGVEVPHLYGDELHLRQVFINILGNSVKFTQDGGKIIFTLTELVKKDDTVKYQFDIEDTGIGMSEEFLKTIWDAFSQEDDGSRTQYKGTGLGMAITKQFVDMMGGDISVTSVKGEGSKFTIKMSFDINNEYVDFKEIDVQSLNLEGIRVLLVEDNELNIEIAKTLLEENGLIVDVAENGKIALDKFAAADVGEYDAIFMDVMMPEMNGLEATRRIRALSKTDAQTIPIIAMTANAYDDDIKKTLESGMNEHISKPIEIKMVLATLARLLKK